MICSFFVRLPGNGGTLFKAKSTVKDLLGHKTLTMTLRYAHLAPSHKVKAVDILDGVIGNQKKPQNLTAIK
jgi:integrase